MKNTNLHFLRPLAVVCLSFFALNTAFAGGDPKAGQEKATAKGCVGCHGETGNGDNPLYPKLAGQYSDYLEKALADYKSGARKSPIMAGMAGALSKEDRADLAAFYSHQDGDLVTPK